MTRYYFNTTIDVLDDKFLNAEMLHFRNIDKLPDNIEDCHHIIKIKIENSTIETLNIPSKVRKLIIISCKISNIIVDTLTLEKLFISWSVQPDIIVKNNNLKQFALNVCGLTEIPEIVKSFKNIQMVLFNHNNIKIIPEWMGDLQHLTHIDLSDNNISIIPENLQKLNLEAFGIDDSNLTGDYDYFTKSVPSFGTFM